MILDWLVDQPLVVGATATVLMWADWLLTIAQERERAWHYAAHYESYPVNTIEGSPVLQRAVAEQRVFHPGHALAALVIGGAVAVALILIPTSWRPPFVGYVWGMFLVVIYQHLSNLLGYRAARQGVHGKIRLHQRTAYITQAGRYVALTLLILVLALLTQEPFLFGVMVAAAASALRQRLRARRVPASEPGAG